MEGQVSKGKTPVQGSLPDFSQVLPLASVPPSEFGRISAGLNYLLKHPRLVTFYITLNL